MRVKLEGWKPYVNNLPILQRLAHAILKSSQRRKLSYRTKKVPNISLIGGRWEVRYEQGCPSANLNVNRTPIEDFLVTGLSGDSISLRIKLDNRRDRIAFRWENLQGVDFAALDITSQRIIAQPKIFF